MSVTTCRLTSAPWCPLSLTMRNQATCCALFGRELLASSVPRMLTSKLESVLMSTLSARASTPPTVPVLLAMPVITLPTANVLPHLLALITLSQLISSALNGRITSARNAHTVQSSGAEFVFKSVPSARLGTAPAEPVPLATPATTLTQGSAS
jgi:hypothetical protein